MGNIESLRSLPSEALLGGLIIVGLAIGLALKPEKLTPSRVYAAGIIALLIVFLRELAGFAGNAGAERLFEGLLLDDPFSRAFKLICLISSVLFFLLSLIARETSRRFDRAWEYALLALAMTLGMMLLTGASNLLMMYLALEFLSLISYLLTVFADRDSRDAEAAAKYLLYGGTASGVMLYGLSLVFGMSGSLDYAAINSALFASGPDGPGIPLAIAVLMVFAGMGFKIAAFPFHAWAPDVYEGAPTPFSAFLSVGSKAASFAMLARFLYLVIVPPGGAWPMAWTLGLAAISAVTMTYGNLAALKQQNIKRLLAYSSIAHAGYALMALSAGGAFGLQALTVYMSVYLIMNFGAFAAAAVIANKLNSELIEDYEGMAWKGAGGAFLAGTLGVQLFSLTGVPPFAGFVGKLYLIIAVVERGSVLYWLAAIAALNTVISFYYYARILRLMFLSKRKRGADISGEGRIIEYFVLGSLALLSIALGIFWGPLQMFGQMASAMGAY